jgi:hypothetical protein
MEHQTLVIFVVVHVTMIVPLCHNVFVLIDWLINYVKKLIYYM